jgi:hypothetical protein
MYFVLDCARLLEQFEWNEFVVGCDFSDVEDIFEHFLLMD